MNAFDIFIIIKLEFNQIFQFKKEKQLKLY